MKGVLAVLGFVTLVWVGLTVLGIYDFILYEIGLMELWSGKYSWSGLEDLSPIFRHVHFLGLKTFCGTCVFLVVGTALFVVIAIQTGFSFLCDLIGKFRTHG